MNIARSVIMGHTTNAKPVGAPPLERRR
jgi:hypothetical protein